MRKALVDKNEVVLSIRRQCSLLDVNRNRLEPPDPKRNEEDRRIMEILDTLHLEHPSFGARMFRYLLKRDYGLKVGRKRIRRLMNLACIEACYRKPRTSLPGKGHKIYPYLLWNMDISDADEVWCSDITYLPMPRGFCYLCAIMDWHSRAVLGWSISTSMDTGLCLEAFEKALTQTGRSPKIMNTDQGSQYSSEAWTSAMKAQEIAISMDGKGRWVDNVFIERLWKSLKYEDVYLKAYDTPRELEQGVGGWLNSYNHYRPHSSHGGSTPWSVYIGEESRKEPKAA